MVLRRLIRFLLLPQLLSEVASGQAIRGGSSPLSRSLDDSSRGDSVVQNIINDMSVHFGSSEDYNPDFVTELRSCMAKWDDPNLEHAADEQWRKIISYYNESPAQDPWVNCLEDPNHDRCSSSMFAEGALDNAATFGDGTAREMVVEEPCNYSSNVAYYHAALRICNRKRWSEGEGSVAIRNSLKRSFVMLAGASALYHASVTKLGLLYDDLVISTIAYISYESLVDTIGGPSKLRCLSEEPCASSEEVARRVAFISLDYGLSLDGENKTEWQNEMESIKESFPHTYEHTFAATIVIMTYICFPAYIAMVIVDSMASMFDLNDFKTEVMTEVMPLIKGLRISYWDRLSLVPSFVGSISKIGYAFAFREVEVDIDEDTDPMELMFGVAGAAMINRFSGLLAGSAEEAFPFAAGEFGTYPGDERCNTQSAHALWHQQSAEGLSELNLFVDSIVAFVRTKKGSNEDI